MLLYARSIFTAAMFIGCLDWCLECSWILSHKLRTVRIICMEDKVANGNTQALSEEAVSDVNPTVLIGVFIAVSTFFILASTIGSVVESFSWDKKNKINILRLAMKHRSFSMGMPWFWVFSHFATRRRYWSSRGGWNASSGPWHQTIVKHLLVTSLILAWLEAWSCLWPCLTRLWVVR